MEWTPDQTVALTSLKSQNNVFLTGGAGTGKSTVIREVIKDLEDVAVLASTGTAAILLGGRTFHSFFGLGIMEGPSDLIVERALKHRGIVTRLRKTKVVMIDEISMIGSPEFTTAEKIARMARRFCAVTASSAHSGKLRL
jgi:ATP-dependent DNA helicase PIF1